MPITKNIFLCSTAYDLKEERDAIESILSNPDPGIIIKCLRSESPDFLNDPVAIGLRHSYDLCLDQIEEADYVILLLKNRYGRPLIESEGKHISITHAEYRKAFGLRKPIFCFADKRLLDARHRLKDGDIQDFVPQNQLGIFDLLEEYMSQKRNNWVHIYDSVDYLTSSIHSTIFQFDDSILTDETVADGSFVYVGQSFKKTWTLLNRGMVAWKNRYLKQVKYSPLHPKSQRIEIPETAPGEQVVLEVEFEAPSYPALCVSTWKMHESDGRLSFPNKRGVYCMVNADYVKP